MQDHGGQSVGVLGQDRERIVLRRPCVDGDRQAEAAGQFQLRLEGAALVRRDYEATIPPKVTYSLTQRGHELDDVLGKLAEIGMRWEAEDAALRAARAAELKAAE